MFHYFLVTFYVVESVLASNTGSPYQQVYVNFKKGSDNSSCGPLIQPCKHLATALTKSTGEVIIMGTITLNKPVTISRSITIRSDNEHHQPPTVEGEGMSKRTTFKLESGAELTIKGIRFIDVGIVKLSRNTKVSIDNCSVTGNVDRAFLFKGQRSTLNITNTTFTNITGNVIRKKSFWETGNQNHAAISFIDCRFHTISCSGVYSHVYRDSLTVIRCLFLDVAYDATNDDCFPVHVAHSYSPGYSPVSIINSTFTNTAQRQTNGRVIDVNDVALLNITGSQFNNIVSKRHVIDVWFVTTVALHHNTFNNNKAGEGGSIVSVWLANDEWRFVVGATTVVVLHHNTFNNNKASVSIVRVVGTKTISIDHCNFTNNIGGRYPVVYIVPNVIYSPIISVTNITNTNFHNNTAEEFAHNIYNIGHLTLRNVSVITADISNSLNQIVSQVGNFSAQNVVIRIQRTRVTTENNGMLVLSPQIKRLSNVSFYCPVNFNVDLDLNYESVTKVFNSLSLKCASCTKGTYSLENGTLALPELTTKYNEYVKEGNIKCIECPVGGTCEDGGLKASPNFWGFKILNHVSFFPCPLGYCCTSEGTQCKRYNTCNKGRKGNLCGACEKGYRLNFFNNSCIKRNDKCDNIMFATYSTIYSLSITLFFAYVANITDVLKRVWIRLKRKMNCFDAVKRVWIPLKTFMRCFDNDESPILEDQDSNAVLQNKVKIKSSKIPKLAVFHLLVFYYQLANLLHVKVEKQNTKNISLEGIKSKVTNFVYFRFTVHVHEHVCPTREINFFGKTGIDLVFKLSILINILLFFITWKLLLIIKKKTRRNINFEEVENQQFVDFNQETDRVPGEEDDQDQDHEQSQSTYQEQGNQPLVMDQEGRQIHGVELDIQPIFDSNSDTGTSTEDQLGQIVNTSDTDDDKVRPMPFPIRLKLTLVKLLKTIFTPVTKICFQLVFCISINGVERLYLYGDLVCFKWWQNLIMTIVIPGLILFPLTFGMSLHLIQTLQITSTKFLIAAGVPYFALYLYLKKRIVGVTTPVYSVEDEMFVNEILTSYEEVFRQHNQLISWPVVQLYRNFVVAAVKTFIIDPMYRSLTFLPIFCLFFVHDRAAKPFLNKSVNVLQTSSTVCLTMIVICNMIFSFSLYLPNIDTIPHMNTVLTVLSYVESIVYFVFPLMLPISIVWRKYTKKEKEE